MVLSGIVDRARLRSRFERSRPAILALVAPAGYGKSTLVRMLFGERPGTQIVDCVDVRDDLDLARRLAVDIEDTLNDGSRSAADRVALALDHFCANPPHCVIFENARFIAARGEVVELVAKLLERRPAPTTVVFSSRKALPIRFTRYAAPHEIVVLRASDLAFDREEQRRLFAPFVTDAAALERIARVSEGWPIALFLLQRFAREGRIEKLLGRLGDVAFGELHDYLAHEVLAMYDAPKLQALFACAAMPEASDADVHDAFPDALCGDALAEFAKESPFLTRDADARYRVHPLVAAAVLEHQEERKRLIVAQLALAREADGDYLRAAELHAAAGDYDAAAAALAQYVVFAGARLPQRYLRLLKRFEPSQVMRYPQLYGTHALMRLYIDPPATLLDEVESIWRTVPADVSMRHRFPIFVVRIRLMAYLGDHARALSELDAFLVQPADAERVPYLLALRAFVVARMGALDAASADIERGLGEMLKADALAAAAYLVLGVEIARVRGDRMEMQFLERALGRAEESGFEHGRAIVLAHMLVSSWLTGNDARARELAEELERIAARGTYGFAYPAGAVLRRDVAPSSRDLPEFAIYGHFIALSDALDDERRHQLARDALARAQRLGVPFLCVLGGIACALVDEEAFEEHAARAVEVAATIESNELWAAVASFAERRMDCGFLSPFVARLSRREVLIAPIEISIAGAQVRVDGTPVAIAGRELELLVAIALRREPSSRSRLASLLWPDLDEPAARNVFSVCLHRLRSHLPRKDVIERDGEGYRLHAHAAVDLWELENVLGVARKQSALSERDRAKVERMWQALDEELPIAAEHWEWFESTARRLDDARVELAHALGEDALLRKDSVAALRYASAALQLDRCDEVATEIGIRAQLIADDRAAAMRLYRQYREALQAELGTQPSSSLTALVTTT